MSFRCQKVNNMSAKFNVLAGPAMSGKTFNLCCEVLKKADENPDKFYYVIVPDQAGNAYEKKLIELSDKLYGRPGFMNIDILGFNRLAYRIFEELGVRETTVLEEYEKNMLVRVVSGRIKNNLDVYGGSVDHTGFTREVKSLISEMIQYNVTPDDLDECIRKMPSGNDGLLAKLRDVSKIYRGFVQVLSEKSTTLDIDPSETGITISEERLKLLVRLLKGDRAVKTVDGTVFFFDEYRGYTPDQLAVIGELAKRTEAMTFGICIDQASLKMRDKLQEHELFHQSSMCLKGLQKVMMTEPVITTCNRISGGSEALRHLSENIFRYPVQEYKGEVDDSISIYHTDSLEDEIKLVAQAIRREVKAGLRYRDIVVVTGDVEGFDRYGSRIFEEYDIPLFSDYSRMLRKNPYTEAMIRSLEIIDLDFDHNSLFTYAKTGVLNIEDKHALDELENFALRTGIRGISMWEKKIRPYGKNITQEETERCERMDAVRCQILDSLSPLLSINKKAEKVKNIITALRSIMESLGFESSMEKSAEILEKEGLHTDARVMRSLYGLLDKILLETEDLLGGEVMSLHDFTEILASGVSEISVGVIPPTIDSVRACDVDRSRIVDAKVVHFINMNDGVVPVRRGAGKILSEKDKDKLSDILKDIGEGKSLAESGLEQSINELFLIYQIFSKAADKLTLSYHTNGENGEASEPSFLVGRVERLFENLHDQYSRPEQLAGTAASDKLDFISWIRDGLEDQQGSGAVNSDTLGNIVKYIGFVGADGIPELETILPGLEYSNKADRIPDEIMRNIDLRLSVSKLEKYASCPYEYFLQYILDLKERPEKKLEYYDVGIIIHSALEKSFLEVRGEYENNWSEIDDSKLVELMNKNLDTAWEEAMADQELDGKTKEVKRNLKKLAERTIKTLKTQIVAGGFTPDRFEQEFTAEFTANRPDGSEVPVTLKGKIDRLDMSKEDGNLNIRVIDYKTGSQGFEPAEIEQGTAIQLLVYTKIVREILKARYKEGDVLPEGMYYYTVSDPVVDLDKNKKIDPENETDLINAINKELVPKGISNKEIPTEDLCSIGDYSAQVMKQSADRILAGEFDKAPIKFAHKQTDACAYCSYKAVCRFTDYSGKRRYISRPELKGPEMMRVLAEKSRQGEEVEITKKSF